MDADMVIDIGQQALMITVLVATPILLTALVIGLVIGMLQAATQIQEMTLSFIPKLLGMFLAMAIFGTYMLQLLVDFMRGMIELVPQVIG